MDWSRSDSGTHHAPGIWPWAKESRPRVSRRTKSNLLTSTAEHIVSLLLGTKFVDKVFVVGSNILRCKAHCRLLVQQPMPGSHVEDAGSAR
jgi:hypothetical protein